MLVNVQIEDYELLDMLLDRLDYWGRQDERDLYEKMYQMYLENEMFGEFNVSYIVDNDVINYCDVISSDNRDFKKLLNLYHKGEYDVSYEDFENGSYSFIEAVSDDEDRILIRY